MKKAGLLSLFVIFMVLAGVTQHYYDTAINYTEEKNVFVTLPSGGTLKILSFGFQNLTADMLFIWSIQFYSAYHFTNRFDYIENVFNLITDLHPGYMEPYLVGSWIMALEAKDIRMAIRLLEKGSRNIPDEWVFDHEIAFYAYKELKDFDLAEKYFKRASEKPGAPSYLKRRWAHMIYLKDDLVSAYNLWVEIANSAKTRMEQDAAKNHLYQIKMEMDKKLVKERSQLFKNKYNRFPASLEELRTYGFIREIPLDFKSKPYSYDPQTGEISARKSFKWKKF
jgi:tetratricopeptide (TPR) repeat protein